MAEIEVLLDFGTPYVRLDDYNAMKERYWRQAGLTQTADDEAAKWKEHARAAVARAEAAEAEAVDLHRQLAEMAAVMEEIEDERLALLARVAELEAQAAQGWRPLGAPPASTGEYLIGADYIPDVLLAEYHADTDMWYQQLPDGEWQLADWATHWRPLPPAPQETE